MHIYLLHSLNKDIKGYADSTLVDSFAFCVRVLCYRLVIRLVGIQ